MKSILKRQDDFWDVSKVGKKDLRILVWCVLKSVIFETELHLLFYCPVLCIMIYYSLKFVLVTEMMKISNEYRN